MTARSQGVGGVQESRPRETTTWEPDREPVRGKTGLPDSFTLHVTSRPRSHRAPNRLQLLLTIGAASLCVHVCVCGHVHTCGTETDMEGERETGSRRDRQTDRWGWTEGQREMQGVMHRHQFKAPKPWVWEQRSADFRAEAPSVGGCRLLEPDVSGSSSRLPLESRSARRQQASGQEQPGVRKSWPTGAGALGWARGRWSDAPIAHHGCPSPLS